MKHQFFKTLPRFVLTLVFVVIASMAILHLWHYYTAEPWTRDGRVRGDVIEVSSDVSGLVTDVLVEDNQWVKKGQPLFKIDIARQALDFEQAKSDLAKTKADLAQAQAEHVAAQADLRKSESNMKLADRNATRYATLLDGAISKQEQDQIFAQKDQVHAEHGQFQARIEQSKANMIKQQALIDVAHNNLNLAQLNLQRSEVVAPADGTLANFELKAGSYVKTGQAVAALLDRKQLYVVGYFEETKLNKIYPGVLASVELMGTDQQLKGHVQGIATGIEDRARSTSSGLLANVNPTFSWVRLAQRVPVKIILDEYPENDMAFVAGRTATIHILPESK